jgi:hypothetical protein
MRVTVKKTKDGKCTTQIDLDRDAWPKFEALVKSAAKMGHKPHDAKPTVEKRAISKKRAPSA